MLALAALIASLTVPLTGGCRSCSNCHDYDPPVANCDCGACGTQRAGSVCSGCSGGSCGCGSCGCETGGQYAEGPMMEGAVMEGQVVEPSHHGAPTPANAR
jgi:hypothetical protein